MRKGLEIQIPLGIVEGGRNKPARAQEGIVEAYEIEDASRLLRRRKGGGNQALLSTIRSLDRAEPISLGSTPLE